MWAPRFSRRINDWEVIEVERLLLRLQGRRVYSDVEDEVIWTKAMTEDSQLSLFIRIWIQKDVKNFLQTSFGILWCLRG